MRNTILSQLCTAALILTAATTINSIAQEKGSAPKTEASKTVTVAEYTFKFNKPWVQQQAGGMRSAVLRYAQADEKLENVDAVFFHMGGSVKSNLDRWKGQFNSGAEVKIEEKEVNGTKISYFIGKGSFMDSMGGPFAPKEEKNDYGVLGAILPSANGRLVFLKLKGPAASVEAVKKAFFELTESALGEKK